MKKDYTDITERIPEPPIWWDEHGAPRYRVFNPEMDTNWKAHEAALVHIECQHCHEKFVVLIDGNDLEIGKTLCKNGAVNIGGYGDPPAHKTKSGMGCIGDTMISCQIKIVEYWQKNGDRRWIKHNEFAGKDLIDYRESWHGENQ